MDSARDPALAGMTWPGVPGSALVLIPLGATEQHGPHLPSGTDALIADRVARAVADALASPAVVAPVLPFGSSGEHADFPGTMSIGREVLDRVVVELVRSLSSWATRVVLINGHGGNSPTLSTCVPRLRSEGHDVAWLPCAVPGGDAHAGRTETSLLLHLEPGLVDLSAAVPGDTRPIGDLLLDLVASGVRAVSPTGVLGDPSGASASEGLRIFDDLVRHSTNVIRDGLADAAGRLILPGVSG